MVFKVKDDDQKGDEAKQYLGGEPTQPCVIRSPFQTTETGRAFHKR